MRISRKRVKTFKAQTYHSRNSAPFGGPSYVLEARGCGSAEVNGIDFNTCAGLHTRTY